MSDKDLSISNEVNERTSLVNGEAQNSIPSDRQDAINRRSSAYLNEQTKAIRFRDIRICYFGIFVSSIVFSITISSIWPFVQTLDKTTKTTFLGWLVSAFSIGQLITSPILGYIANRTDNNKMPLVISTALIVVANILYAYVQLLNSNQEGKWWLLASRFIMGIGAANSTIMRSYASSATTMKERTNVMANLSAYQGIGFILGPLIQALFVVIKNHPVNETWICVNIYTAPAYFNALTAGINLLLFLFVFKDMRVVTPIRRSIHQISPDHKASKDERHNQLMALLCCLYLFLVAYLTFTNYETIASPLSIDMYGWSKEQSTAYNGYLLGGLGAMSVVVLIVTKILAKRFEERVLVLFGMIISFFGYFVFLPWGGDIPNTQIATYTPRPPLTTNPLHSTTSMMTTTAIALSKCAFKTSNETELIGCPLNYSWCTESLLVRLWQYIVASVVITSGFTVSNVITYSIYSKKLGDRPQGTMMGIFSSVGSLARFIGPIIVGFLYEHLGPRAMMIFMLVVVLTSIIALLWNYKRLYIEPEPLEDSLDEDVEQNNGGVNSEE